MKRRLTVSYIVAAPIIRMGNFFSFPPGSLPIQRISPLLTTFPCPDERMYPSMCIMASPINDMATNWANICISVFWCSFVIKKDKIMSFVDLHQRSKYVSFLRNINEEWCMTLAGLHSTLTSSLMQCNDISIKYSNSCSVILSHYWVTALIVTPLELADSFIGCKRTFNHMAERCKTYKWALHMKVTLKQR